MKLLPSLKQKKRYVVFEILSESKFTVKDIQDEVERSLLLFFGQLGLSKTSPLMVKVSGNRFIIKINHKYVDELKSALTLSKKIKNTSIIIKSIITTGTIKKANEHL